MISYIFKASAQYAVGTTVEFGEGPIGLDLESDYYGNAAVVQRVKSDGQAAER